VDITRTKYKRFTIQNIKKLQNYNSGRRVIPRKWVGFTLFIDHEGPWGEYRYDSTLF
jgi:hypothetical protein